MDPDGGLPGVSKRSTVVRGGAVANDGEPLIHPVTDLTAGIIGAGAAAVLRWGVVDGIRRSRWTSPQYRARYLEQKGR
jgi:hypothetical protein